MDTHLCEHCNQTLTLFDILSYCTYHWYQYLPHQFSLICTFKRQHIQNQKRHPRFYLLPDPKPFSTMLLHTNRLNTGTLIHSLTVILDFWSLSVDLGQTENYGVFLILILSGLSFGSEFEKPSPLKIGNPQNLRQCLEKHGSDVPSNTAYYIFSIVHFPPLSTFNVYLSKFQTW